jgi:AcrR family transcriptional regulator
MGGPDWQSVPLGINRCSAVHAILSQVTISLTAEPPPSGLAARKKERTRRQLAEAAAELFYERGYAATTVDDIVAAVDVSPRTFFRYFPTKEDLVVALGTTSLDLFINALRARPADESLQVAVRAAIEESLAPGWEDAVKVRSFLTLLQETPALRARWLEEAYGVRNQVAEVIAARTGTGPTDLRNLITAGTITLVINTALQAWADQDAEAEIAPFVYQGLEALATPLLPN